MADKPSPPASPLPPSGPENPIERVLEAFAHETAAGISDRSEFERLKGRFLGREKGLVPGLFARLKDLPPADRAAFGSRANTAKREIEDGVSRLAEEISRREAESRDRGDAVDVTLPGRRARVGGLHPGTVVRRRIERIFLRMGYSVADGAEIENDRYNFEALSFAPDQSARE